MRDVEKLFINYIRSNNEYMTKAATEVPPYYLQNHFDVYNIYLKVYNKCGGIVNNEQVFNDVLFNMLNMDRQSINQIVTKIKSIAMPIPHQEDNKENFNTIVELIKSRYKKRVVVDISTLVVDSNLDDYSQEKLTNVISKIQNKINEAVSVDTSIEETSEVGEDADNRWEDYKWRKDNPDSVKLYKTGFNGIDKENGGLSPGELIYIIGRKGGGKSVLMLNLAYNFWIDGNNVILFSIEINKRDYMRRFDSRACNIPSNKLKRGLLSDSEEITYHNYLESLKQGKFQNKNIGKLVIIDIPGKCTPGIIEEKVKEQEQKLNCIFPIVISDYAGIMQPNEQQKELRHSKAQIALELKQYARKYGKIVISAEQMNRVGKNQKKTENDAIAESDAVADHIDVGMAIRLNDSDEGVIESFKTRDMAPFTIPFRQAFDVMRIDEEEDMGDWNLLDAD